MVFRGKQFKAVLAGFIAIVITVGLHCAVAQDVVHGISGVVKSVDKGTKTFVVKSADGTEHTFKWTDKTAVKGAKDTGKAIDNGTEDTGKDIDKSSVDTYMGAKKGAKVTVKYTEKGGEKTAVGVKDAGKATGKALAQ